MFLPFNLGESFLNTSFMEKYSFLRLPFTLWKNTVLISSITFFNAFTFALILFLWATNRQTQIRPSKSQTRAGPERKGKKILAKNLEEGDIDFCNSEGNYSFSDVSKSNQQDLFSNDWGRSRSRENLLRSFSMEFDEDEEDDDSDESELKSEELSDNDYGHLDISFGNEDKPTISSQYQTLDIKEFISNMNLFSYLSDGALIEVLKYIRYIDLPDEGSPILRCFEGVEKRNPELDGSLYIVIDGSVNCSCHIDDERTNMTDRTNLSHSSSQDSSSQHKAKLNFTAGPGDLITSRLAIISDLVRLFQNKDSSPSQCIHPVVVHATTSEPNTRILYVPSTSYLKVLEKYPQEVHQLTQTILGRTQRVTMTTLVKTFGLTDEIIAQEYSSWKEPALNHIQDSSGWINNLEKCQQKIKCHKKQNGEKYSCVDKGIKKLKVSEELMHGAASLAATQLGTTRNEDVELIFEHSSIVLINAGSTFIQMGKKLDYLYFLIDGVVEFGNFIATTNERGLDRSMTRPFGTSMNDLKMNVKELERDKSVSFQLAHTVKAGALVGQLAAYTGEVSMTTIRVSPNIEAPAIMLEIPKSVFVDLVTANSGTLIQSLRSIIKNDFSPFVHLLDWGIRWRDVNTGFVLAKRGESCQSTYVVLNGRLRSGIKRDNSGLVIKEEHGRGSRIGEVQVLTGGFWPDDVYAIRDSELAEVPLSVLEFIMNMFPTCGVHFLLQRYVKKDRNTATQESSGLPSYKLSVATIAVIPICFGSNNYESSTLCEHLISCLRNIAPCATMTKALVRKKLGKSNLKNFVYALKLSRLLGDLEENNRLVVYQAEPQFNWWTKTCIEHSDCILLVVDSQQTPEIGDLLLKFLTRTQSSSLKKRVEIVILTKTSKDSKTYRAQGLNDWVDKLPFMTGRNLIRISGNKLINVNKTDMKRMCRRITGCSLGLALGGGGARGIAHLGVIKALLEAGVLVDIVGGTSQGAFIGALFAQNPDDVDLLIKRARMMADKMSSMRDKVFDLTLPLVSYFDGRRFNQVIKDIIGKETKIEDLLLSFFCVSTDLQLYSQKVHRRGLCWKYVRASMSLHGYLPPISEEGSLLLDGGYTCVVPNEVMSKEIGARAVIAVDVSREEMPKYFEYGSNLNGFWLLWNSWNPFVKTVRVPSMGELSTRLIWVNSSRQQQKIEDNCDLFLSPEVHEYGTLDYHLFDEIFEIGYSYTKAKIEKFLEDPGNRWILCD